MAKQSTSIDGVTYLLVTAPSYTDSVARYTAPELFEVFSAAELATLADTGIVRRYKGKTLDVTYTNMVFAARLQNEANPG